MNGKPKQVFDPGDVIKKVGDLPPYLQSWLVRQIWTVITCFTSHERLKKHGRFDDSFDDILNRLMDMVEGKGKK